MRRYFALLSILTISMILANCAGQAGNAPIRVMTFNIRLNSVDDGPNQWLYRKDMAASMIRFHKADIAGLQEALKDQVDDLAARLPEYGWFGVGRDDGKEKGEYMAVFYRKDRFKVLEQSTFWLSETPDSVTKGWDAACFRVVTWGKFGDQRTGKKFYLFNTHFDHIGEVARRESAKLILERIDQTAGSDPVIVTGDFNSPPDSEPYQILTKGLPGKEATGLINTENIAQFPHHGPDATFTAFQSSYSPGNKPIDFIFTKNKVQVIFHGTLSDTFDGKYPSDHMPVLAEVIVE
jgi:endonuclease/exonuclease/phosphatase family metal-dependent hydrolase